MEEKNLILRDLRTVHVNGDGGKLHIFGVSCSPPNLMLLDTNNSASTSAVSAAMLTNPHRIERLDSKANAPNAITLLGEKAIATCLVWTGTPRPANKYFEKKHERPERKCISAADFYLSTN